MVNATAAAAAAAAPAEEEAGVAGVAIRARLFCLGRGGGGGGGCAAVVAAAGGWIADDTDSPEEVAVLGAGVGASSPTRFKCGSNSSWSGGIW